MKILNSKRKREADQFTINNEPISSLDLMERASVACVNWIKVHFSLESEFQVICGTGNNGGDGLAIARLLADLNYKVSASIIRFAKVETDGFKTNLKRLKELEIELNEITAREKLQLKENAILIDAILGSGLNNPLKGDLKKRVQEINNSEQFIISIDVPSGLYIDAINGANEVSIHSNVSLTFQTPPLSFFAQENEIRVGEWHLLDIGLNQEFIEESKSQYHYIESYEISEILQPRQKHDYKGSFGHAILIAGSKTKGGAAILSAKSAMRSGLGLLTMGIPEILHQAMLLSCPEAMTSLVGEDEISSVPDIEVFNAIGIGPGIGVSKSTSNFLKVMIQNAKVPILIDADALNILAENKTWLSFIPANSIFTPHIGEFKRLILNSDNSFERLNAQIEFSKKYQSIVILKGANAQITLPDGRVYFNSTGNPGMGTAGSGDVLTGLITGLLARRYYPMFASILGVYLHGLAGDIAADKFGEEAMKAQDIIEQIPTAFRKFGA